MEFAARRSSIGIAVSLVAAIAIGCVGAPAPESELAPAAPTVRAPDAFYDPPADVPAEPGKLLRSEPLTDVTLPPGMQGWRLLYTTTVDDATPATAVATLFAPLDLPAGPLPVVAWAHGTTGVLQKCMPSLVSSPAEDLPARDRLVELGWAVVATDYAFAEPGGPHPYLIGEGEARSVLDAVRAARSLRDVLLDDGVVVWGHSQGGHAALWTGIVGPRYAPDVEIAGVAAIAPAANVESLLTMSPAVEKLFGAYVALAYGRFYPDVPFEEAVRPEALEAAREITGLCASLPPEDAQRILALAQSFEGPALAASTNEALTARLAENTADRRIEAPVLIAQGLADVLVPPPATQAFLDERCAARQPIEYWSFATLDHSTIVRPGSPLEAPLVAWTQARFADEGWLQECTRKEL